MALQVAGVMYDAPTSLEVKEAVSKAVLELRAVAVAPVTSGAIMNVLFGDERLRD